MSILWWLIYFRRQRVGDYMNPDLQMLYDQLTHIQNLQSDSLMYFAYFIGLIFAAVVIGMALRVWFDA